MGFRTTKKDGKNMAQKRGREYKAKNSQMIDFDANAISFYTDMDVPSVYIFTSKALIRDYLNIFKDYNSTTYRRYCV